MNMYAVIGYINLMLFYVVVGCELCVWNRSRWFLSHVRRPRFRHRLCRLQPSDVTGASTAAVHPDLRLTSRHGRVVVAVDTGCDTIYDCAGDVTGVRSCSRFTSNSLKR